MSSLPFPPLLFVSMLVAFAFLLSTALSAFTVTHLPGFRGALPFHMETGYVRVDEVNDGQLFYYFVRSERNPKEDPVLLWLTGGSRCSAFSGLAFEIGPIRFVAAEYNGSLPSLVYNPYSWTQVSNVIFLDAPAGAGFSFARNPAGYDVGDTTKSKQIHKFLIKWFIDHPQFLSNPLYIAGDSYAGKIVPIAAQEISQGIEAGLQPLLNLKGYVVGNPFTGEKVDNNAQVPFAHGVGIISDELYEIIESLCEGEDYTNPQNALCATNLAVFNKFIDELSIYFTLDPHCPLASPKPKDWTRRSLRGRYSDILLPPTPAPELKCRNYVYYLSYFWANDNATREALHIKKGTKEEWVRCNYELPYDCDVPSSIKYHRNLTSRGYRALVYSGDHDINIPFVGTKEWIKSLNYSIVDDWRSWHVDGQVAGYTRLYYNNLTFATVMGAGHTAPEYMPRQCLAMFRRWISNKPL